MAVETTVEPDVARRQLKMFFEQTRPVSQLLATLRSRRVGRGYAIESGRAGAEGQQRSDHRAAEGTALDVREWAAAR